MAGLVIFRVDASPSTGGGHAVRCLSLADQLAALGWQCQFAVQPQALDVVPTLKSGPHGCLLVPEAIGNDMRADADWLRDEIVDKVDVLVIDSYRHGVEFEEMCRPWANCEVAIDGTLRRHEVDLWVNPVPGREHDALRQLVPETCNVLTGPAYAMLRSAFSDNRGRSLARRKGSGGQVSRILVSFGASDTANMTLATLQALQAIRPDAHIDILFGNRQKEYSIIATAVRETNLDIELHNWVSDMPEMMARADLFVATAGSSAWEACALGLPSLVVIAADNQKLIAEQLALHGAAHNLGACEDISAAALEEGLRQIIENDVARNKMIERSAALCDGLGAERVARAIVELATQ